MNESPNNFVPKNIDSIKQIPLSTEVLELLKERGDLQEGKAEILKLLSSLDSLIPNIKM